MPKIHRPERVGFLPAKWRLYRVIGAVNYVEVGSYVWREDAERTLRFLQRVTPLFHYVLVELTDQEGGIA